ncbi:thiamine pyrophosphate-binding protein [Pseudodesulfovibrio portus]|uniref:Acetolactate synthase n=1 Tax=Pseudodesulfovibrio portus TaxID=231439 RepID=A0ABM8ANB6_9BACT|nr:thiamine pyrophosphate-binding protein [Pseudodesulfovibrio portus]BDQ32902.1 acetolactate synthase [Pseudodesulfovibrio portus]
MNVSDIIIDFLVGQNVSKVFLMTGGHVAFMLDHLYGREDIGYVCVSHEQAASMAADGYSRIRPDSIGVSIATSGPGATNLLTGIGCSWFDSIPSLHLTGQVNTNESKGDKPVRQIGFQEMDIVDMAKPITKWAATVDAPENILWYLEKAVHVAKSGRPGPVLLDIPMNFQRQDVDFDSLPHYVPEEDAVAPASGLERGIAECAALLAKAERPAILAGGGVRNGQATAELRRLAEKLNAPVCLSMNGIDAFPHDHPNYGGFIGVYGNRGGNLTLANSDLIIAVGSRLDSRQTGVDTGKFARFAKKVVVDIDPGEIGSRFTPDVAVHADSKDFLTGLLDAVGDGCRCADEWLNRVRQWREAYPPCPPQYCGTEVLNPYMFMGALSEQLGPDDTVALDTGQNMVWGTQVIHPRQNIRMWTAGGMSPMGYSFPAAIGARLAREKGRAISIIGDGGMQINVQELETIARHNLALTVFVVNNSGLGLIRQFQDDYLGSRHVAATEPQGFTSPDFVAIAEAYGVKALRISDPAGLEAGIRESLAHDGPVLVDVQVDTTCNVIPKALMGHPMEDQFPYIDEQEFLDQMIVEPLDPASYRL